MVRGRFIDRKTKRKIARFVALFDIGTRSRRNAFSIVMLTALSLQILGTGLPALIAQYQDQQARIPHPLASETKNTDAPAADAQTPTDAKAKALPDISGNKAAITYNRRITTYFRSKNIQSWLTNNRR
jgi:hypothetical protein